jgi:hypothetical protein
MFREQTPTIPIDGRGAQTVSDAATTTNANVTPNAMPGATTTTASSQLNSTTGVKPSAAEAKGEESATPDPAGLTSGEREELKRLREVHKDEQKWRREATTKHKDSETLDKVLSALGVNTDAKKDFNAEAAVKELAAKFETSERERIRETVARTEGVDPEDFTGDTEEQMRASAKRFKAKVQALVDAAVERAAKGKQPAAAPADQVTANGKVTDSKQLKSVEGMTDLQIVDAYKNGLLDDMVIGRK